MSATTENTHGKRSRDDSAGSAQLLEQTRDAAHPACVVCSQTGQCGLNLRFEPDGDGGVRATFECRERFQGYSGVLHGG